MERPWDVVLPVIIAIFGSGGFWAFLQTYLTTHSKEREEEDKEMSFQSRMLKGLGHDRIVFLCRKHIERGYISADDFENLNEYLYEPYVALGGNGTAKKLMEDVKKLPSHPPKEV